MKELFLTLVYLGSCQAVFTQAPIPCPGSQTAAADLCTEACVYCDFTGYTGTTAGYSSQTPPGFCGTIENEQWIGFVAGDAEATLTATASDCANGDGIQMALYTACSDPSPIACNMGVSGGAGIPVSFTTALIPGQTYLIMIDGWAGDQCDFTLNITPGSAGQAPALVSAGPVQGPAIACIDQPETYFVSPVQGAGTYIWTAPPGATVNGLTPPVALPANGNSVQVRFDSTAGAVCVQAFNACAPAQNQSCISVELRPGHTTTTLPPVTICFEEQPYLLPWGDSAVATGLYQHSYFSGSGCDSVVMQQVTVRPKIDNYLGVKSICHADSVVVCGTAYYTPGEFTVVCNSSGGCDSTVHFKVLIEGADRCVDACFLCELDGLQGSTDGFTAQGLPGFCGTIENDQWIGFVAGAPEATFTATPSNCQINRGIQMGLFTACNTAPIACATGTGSPVPVSFFANLTPGQVYYLMIDGYAGDLCNFTLSVTPDSAAAMVPADSVGLLQSPDTLCRFQANTFSVAPVSGAVSYTWTAPPGALINGLIPPVALPAGNGASVQIWFDSTTTGPVCVEAAGACAPPQNKSCKTPFILAGIPPLTLPMAVVCAEDVPYHLPWGTAVSGSGFYQHTYTGISGCDSVVQQQVLIKAPIKINLAPKGICKGDSVVVCGKAYHDGGAYTAVCQSYQGCDSVLNFSIMVYEPVAQPLPATAGITCSKPVATLSSAASLGVKTWRNKSGQILGAGDTFQAELPGYYFLHVAVTFGATVCEAEALALVKQLTELPTLSASGGALSKTNPWVVLHAASTFPKVAFAWSGPNGFVSAQQNPVVSVPGSYTVTVTDLITGCTNSAKVNVLYE